MDELTQTATKGWLEAHALMALVLACCGDAERGCTGCAWRGALCGIGVCSLIHCRAIALHKHAAYASIDKSKGSDSMKLTILGENGPFAAAGGACSAYLVEAAGRRILLDCGPGALARLEMVCPLADVDLIVLSHLHYDHMSDMYSGAYNLQQQLALHLINAPVKLMLPDAPSNARAGLAGGAFELISLNAQAGTPFELGGVELEFMPVRHPVPAFAVRISAQGRTLVYSGDTNTCPGLVDFCRGADMLLCDAGLTRAQWSENAPHLSAVHVGELARDAGVGALLATHIHPRVSRAELLDEVRAAYPDARLAEAWMSVEI